MVLYSPDLSPHWGEYGILIPLRDDRSKRVYEQLRMLGKKGLHLIDKNEIQPLGRDDLLKAHSEKFVEKLYSSGLEQEIMECFELVDEEGNYNRYNPDLAKRSWSQFLEAILVHAGATRYAMEKALETDFTFFLGGGMHHARSDKGSGFCLINDIVIGLRCLQDSGSVKSAWVIDTDAHKGDGTAEITRYDNSIKTLSIHMKKGWPLDHPDPSHPSKTPSDIDIEMETDEEDLYLLKLKNGLEVLEDMSMERPGLAIVNAGVDPYELDELQSTQSIKLSKEQMLERDMMVFHF